MVDPRRAKLLRKTILAGIVEHRLHEELGLAAPKDAGGEDALLTRADAYLCELKEAQIRDGLHTFGHVAAGRAAARHAACARTLSGRRRARGECEPHHCARPRLAARRRVRSARFGLGRAVGAVRVRPRSRNVSDAPWRHHGDTRERLELLAAALLQS